MNVYSLESWKQAISEAFQQFAGQIAFYLPQLLSGVAIILLGWVFAYVFSRVARRLFQGLDHIFARIGRNDVRSGELIKDSYALIVQRVVFWITILFFITVSANVMGWDVFSRWLDNIVNYVPGLLTGILVIMAGFVVANLTRSTIMTAALRAGIAQSAAMARTAQILIIFSAVIIGVEEIGLDVDFLSTLIVVVAGTLFAGASLAFSLGARSMVANLLGAQASRKHCRLGETMRIGEVEGQILEITQTAILLETANGRAVIPAKLFHELVSEHRSQSSSQAEAGAE